MQFSSKKCFLIKRWGNCQKKVEFLFGFCIERVLEVHKDDMVVLSQNPEVVLNKYWGNGVLQRQICVMVDSEKDTWLFRNVTSELVSQFESGTIPLEMLFIADVGDEDSILMIDCSKAVTKEYASIKDVPDDIKKGLEV